MTNSPVVVDIAWAKPSIAEIKATGAIGVVRYFSNDPTKNWTLAEFQAYTAAGLAVASVWETVATRALSDYATGQADAREADAQRAAAGFPADMPIHFAVDTDTDWAHVAGYFAGAANVLTRDRVGVYGGIRVIEGAAQAGYPFRWQTLAWSGGRISPLATLYQNGSSAFSGGGDINLALAADWGQYPRQEADMPLTPQEKQDIADLVVQTLFNAPVPNLAEPDGKGGVFSETFIHLPERADLNAATTQRAIAALAQQVAQLGTPTLSDAQVATLAQHLVQNLIPAMLQAFGHALDGTPTT